MKRKKSYLFLIFFVYFLVCSQSFYGQEAAAVDDNTEVINEKDLPISDNSIPYPENGESIGTFSVWDFVRMVLILGAVIGVIYFVFFLLKKAGGGRYQNNELFTVLSSQALAGNKSLFLVEVGNQIFLIGNGDNNLSLISEITDKETIDDIRLKYASRNPIERKSFRELFFKRFQSEKRLDDKTVIHDSVDYMKKQKERLKNFK